MFLVGVFFFQGKPVQLSSAAEEVATFYAKMLDHEYTTKETFQNNFFTDWREVCSSFLNASNLSAILDASHFLFLLENLFYVRLVCPAVSLGNDRR